MEDSFKHKGMRKRLIDELRTMSVADERVLEAMQNVPRHFFLDLTFVEQAYSNVAFQIGEGQTISHPRTVAFQTYLLNIKKGQKILEIGTGSGYQTSVLCELGARVYSIERQKNLFVNAKNVFTKLRYTPNLFYGDGYKGIPSYAPYDGVLVTCGAPFIPPALIEQLKVGGRMVIPIGEGAKQVMHLVVKNEDGTLITEQFGEFSFVPMLEKGAK
jgi:protein-L-isoaspartate(D-aspartate) O-methyltransferase